MQIVDLGKIDNATASILVCVGCAFAAGYIGQKMDKLVRTAGTAFIGAGLVKMGVIFCLKANDMMTDPATGKPLIPGYAELAGLVVLTVVGFLVQLYVFRDEGKSDDDFMAQEDEGRTCGCF